MNTHLKNFLETLALIILAILFRSVLYEPYVVPSSSMEPNLLVGDRIIVKKFSYGISKYSFPLSPPMFKGRILEWQKPQRGDIVVFETDRVYVKRLIGLPGDTIQMLEGKLYLNGKEVPQSPIKPLTSLRYIESLPNGVNYIVLDTILNSYYDNTILYRVPEGHYFFMGDNRDNSSDSRSQSSIGFVPYENILGKVETVFFSSPEVRWYHPAFLFSLDKDRFFKSLN